MRLLEAGEMKQVEIARYPGVTEAAVSKWKKQLAEGGAEGLRMQKSPGRPAKLDQNAKQKLLQEPEKGAPAAGFATERWTQTRVKKVIEREVGVSYHQNSIGRLLTEPGWSVQKLQGRARKG